MTIENANSHPIKVALVSESDGLFANSHPYKVALEGGGGLGGRVVDELPEQGEAGYIYLVLKEETPEGDIYDEYMWVLLQDGETYGWEHIGATNEVDLEVVKTPTADDRNWNSSTGTSGTPDTIALWLLDDGLYISPNESVKPVRNASVGGYKGNMYLVSKSSNTQRGMVAEFSGATSRLYSGIDENGQDYLARSFFPIVRQTTGQSTQDLMSQKAVTDAINDSVGGARILTTADYNWNSQQNAAVEPYDCVAIWKLNPGYYYAQPNVISYKITKNDSSKASGGSFLVAWRGADGTNPQVVTVVAMEGTNWNIKTVSAQLGDGGTYGDETQLVTRNEIVDALTSTATNQPLSANQGKLLGDRVTALETQLAGLQNALHQINNGSGS